MRDAIGRDAWVTAGLARLRRGGVEAVKVEPLARDLGVTKGSFYWHFTDRAALLAALLAAWERRGTRDLIAAAEASGAPPAAQLAAIVERAFALSGREERAVRAWAGHDPRAARALARVDRARLAFIVARMRAHGLSPGAAAARARVLYAAFIGEQQLSVVASPRRRVAGALSVLELLLSARG